MLLNPDLSKQAVGISFFSHKRDKESFPSLVFNDIKVQLINSQKHLALILDSRFDFNEHTDNKINKCNKLVGIIKRLSLTLSTKSLLTV